MAGSALPAAAAVVVLACAAAAGLRYSAAHLAAMPRSQLLADEWMEDSAAGDQSRMRILQSTPERLDVLWECRAGAEGFLPSKPCSPPPHAHEATTEWLTLRRGSIQVLLQGNVTMAPADGGSVRIPPEAEHTAWSADAAAPFEVVVTFMPAGQQEQFFRTINGFGRDYGSLAKVPALQWLVTFDTVGMRPAKIPAFVWRTAVRHVAVPAARLAGFRPFLDDYLAAAAKQHRLGAAAE